MGKFKKRNSGQGLTRAPTIRFDSSYILRLTNKMWRLETTKKRGEFRKAK